MNIPAHKKVGTIVFVGCRLLGYFYKKRGHPIYSLAYIGWEQFLGTLLTTSNEWSGGYQGIMKV